MRVTPPSLHNGTFALLRTLKTGTSADPAHHKVGDVPERLPHGPLGEAIERTDRGVVEGEGALSRAFGTRGATDLVEELADVGTVLRRRGDPSGELRSGAVSLGDRVDHGQRRHSLEEVTPDGLAEIALVADDVEHVIGDLERHP